MMIISATACFIVAGVSAGVIQPNETLAIFASLVICSLGVVHLLELWME